MHALIIVSHPDKKSLTHGVARHVAEGVSSFNPANSFEIADLAAEGFDPRFSVGDIALHLRQAAAPAEILAEQARVDRSDALVLVYPVYWWSMPALLKGWIDRVFTNGWAYDESPELKLVKRLRHLPVHLVGVGGADAGTYSRHGYFNAMKTQIDHGIFDYCGACVVTSELLLPAKDRHPADHLDTARAIGRDIFGTSRPCEAANAA